MRTVISSRADKPASAFWTTPVRIERSWVISWMITLRATSMTRLINSSSDSRNILSLRLCIVSLEARSALKTLIRPRSASSLPSLRPALNASLILWLRSSSLISMRAVRYQPPLPALSPAGRSLEKNPSARSFRTLYHRNHRDRLYDVSETEF